MDDKKDTYRLWRVRKTIMQVSILRVASSDAWDDYIYLLGTFVFNNFLASESDRRMHLLTRVYGIQRTHNSSLQVLLLLQHVL